MINDDDYDDLHDLGGLKHGVPASVTIALLQGRIQFSFPAPAIVDLVFKSKSDCPASERRVKSKVRRGPIYIIYITICSQ